MSLASPFPSGAVVDASGQVTTAWRGFFLQLWQRTGEAAGSAPASLDAVTGLIQAEAVARSSNEAVISGRIDAEASARSSADAANAAAIANEVAARTAEVQIETAQRQDGDTPAAIMAQSFAGLPASDPGGGLLWLDRAAVRVGVPAVTWTWGTGAPTATQPLGSLFSRTDGAVGATLYVSRGGGTWAAVGGV